MLRSLNQLSRNDVQISYLSDLNSEILTYVGHNPPAYFINILYRYGYAPILIITLVISLLTSSWETLSMGVGLIMFALISAVITDKITRYIKISVLRGLTG